MSQRRILTSQEIEQRIEKWWNSEKAAAEFKERVQYGLLEELIKNSEVAKLPDFKFVRKKRSR